VFSASNTELEGHKVALRGGVAEVWRGGNKLSPLPPRLHYDTAIASSTFASVTIASTALAFVANASATNPATAVNADTNVIAIINITAISSSIAADGSLAHADLDKVLCC
jgi:hypothetical protein